MQDGPVTLEELQPYVEAAITAVEWDIARARRQAGLLAEQETITQSLPLAGRYGIEEEPLRARLLQIEVERTQDITADCVPVAPVRSFPMDLITAAVVRRILRLPIGFPVISIKTMPNPDAIKTAVIAIMDRWQNANGQLPDDVDAPVIPSRMT